MKFKFQFYTGYAIQIQMCESLLFLKQALVAEIVMFSTRILLVTLTDT